jgi:methionyl-tRNA formyltransferase
MEPIIFAGTPENAARTLRGLISAGYEIALVITREDVPVGRKRVLTPSAVAAAAKEMGLRVLKTNKISSNDEELIRSSGARLAVVVAFGALLKQSSIDLLELGWFNLHYSLLPRWRGASPVQSALAHGDNSTGITLFKIDAGLDTGAIAGIAQTMIEPTENAERLLTRLTEIGLSLALQELPKLLSGVARLEPQTGEATFAPKIDRSMSRINLEDTALVALNKVRAYNPEPIAWLEFNGEPLRIIEAEHSLEPLEAARLALATGGVLLGCGDSKAIKLTVVQPAGKQKMSAADWFRGTSTTERKIS